MIANYILESQPDCKICVHRSVCTHEDKMGICLYRFREVSLDGNKIKDSNFIITELKCVNYIKEMPL